MKNPTILFFVKRAFLLSFFLFLLTQLYAQTTAETTIVIVACKKGTLIIDGTIIGQVEADDASRQTLSYGEHYLQLKTETEKFSLTITVDQNTKGIFKLGCLSSNTLKETRLIDKQVNLAGGLSDEL